MSYLIDTNIISELVKIRPDDNVINWIKSVPDSSLYLSVLTIGEIRKGLGKITEAGKKEKIHIWLEYDLPKWFNDRILPIDIGIANQWSKLQNQTSKLLPAIDSLLADTAMHHNLVIVTRNVKDFNYINLEVINPWQIY